MARVFARALLVASLPVGIGVGLWTALLRVDISAQVCGNFLCTAFGTPFARWQSALLGVVARDRWTLVSARRNRRIPHQLLSLSVRNPKDYTSNRCAEDNA